MAFYTTISFCPCVCSHGYTIIAFKVPHHFASKTTTFFMLSYQIDDCATALQAYDIATRGLALPTNDRCDDQSESLLGRYARCDFVEDQ